MTNVLKWGKQWLAFELLKNYSAQTRSHEQSQQVNRENAIKKICTQTKFGKLSPAFNCLVKNQQESLQQAQSKSNVVKKLTMVTSSLKLYKAFTL
jgi:translation initiation factor 2 alpha subunit (eIF-2alpha)